MSWRLRWLIIAPVALFVMTTVLMSSCGGGGGGCLGSVNEFGDFVPGLCPSPGPGTGFNLQTIVIAAGTPAAATPTPAATPTGKRIPTPTPTLEPQASPTAGIVGNQVDFHATGLFTKHNLPNPLKVIVADITNSSSTVWSSSNPNVLKPPQPPPNGGIYQALSVGCSCADASSGGVSALPVSVAVVANAGDPTPACPACPTPAITATATPHPAIDRPPSSAASSQPAASNAPTSFNGVLQWTFKGASPIKSQLVASPDGNLYFVTLDGYLHQLDSKGHERWRRRASGSSVAVAPDGTLYALRSDGSLEASSPIGKPLWTINTASTIGPLAASSNAVYFQDNNQLVAATSPGAIQWSVPAPERIASAAISDDGTILAASNSGSVIAIASNGTPRWSFMPQGGFAGEIAIFGDTVYIGSSSGTLYALNLSNGAQQWHRETSAPISAGPVVDSSGSVVFGSDAIYSLTTDGGLAWSKALPKDNAAPIASNGASEMLAPIDLGEMALLDNDGASKWASASFGKVEKAVVSPLGVLYIASEGKVYAVK